MISPSGTLTETLTNSLKVLSLFIIPVGGGIPAGILVAQAKGLVWPLTLFIYLISDIMLAFVFEPLMHLFLKLTKNSRFFTRWREAHVTSLKKMGFKYGLNASPLSLIMISFGVDPMTGRAAAKVAGHGFITGWAIAITGDMIFFSVIMVSTLWLNSVLGDGTWTAIIIMVLMFAVPALIRKLKGPPHEIASSATEATGNSTEPQ